MFAALTSFRLAAWAWPVLGLVWAGLGLWQARRLPRWWRRTARGALAVVVVWIVALGNPWAWDAYDLVLDEPDLTPRQSDLLRHRCDASRRSDGAPHYLVVGSESAQRAFGGYARAREDLQVFTVAGWTPADLAFDDKPLFRLRPRRVLLYLSPLDLTRSPRESPEGIEGWVRRHIPPTRCSFVFAQMAAKAGRRLTGKGPSEAQVSAPSSPDERYLRLQSGVLRQFLTDCAQFGIEVIFVEDPSDPALREAGPQALVERGREALAALAWEFGQMPTITRDELPVLQAHDLPRPGEVTEEAGQRIARAVFARLEDRPELARYNPATTPIAGDRPGWTERFEQLQRRVAAAPDAEVLFFGDSITQGFEREGRDPWAELNRQFSSLNLGIGGDRTEHLLWRLDHMDLARLRPKAVVVLIGTNNCARPSQSPAEIAEGIEQVVARLQAALPAVTVLLHRIFPRGEPGDPAGIKAEQVNEILAARAARPHVEDVDLAHLFVDASGSVRRDLLPDLLHLSPEGYSRWVDALRERLMALPSP